MLGFGSKYSIFWKWFQAHEDEVFDFESDREKVFNKLAAQLRRVHPQLTFEFSSVFEGRREFVVSAGGIREVFPEVVTLVREAPSLPKWQIIAFRQRKDMPKVKYGGKELDRDSLFFDYALAGSKIDLTLFVPGMVNASEGEIVSLKTMGYLFLDGVVGEYDVETKIAGIEFVDASLSADRRRIPFRELVNIIDKLPRIVQ